MDKYKNFAELKQHERKGRDYDIQIRKGFSGIAVIAPHGGGIEPGTLDIADSVAGDEHHFYCFKGIKRSGNTDLHITSDRFDEPHGIRIVEEADFVLAVHGCSGNEEVIFIGGSDHEFKKRLLEAIVCAGFVARESSRPRLKGIKPANICNRSRTGRGGQIEISEGLREKMIDNLTSSARKGKNKVFFEVVGALRIALETCADLETKRHRD